jgi:hypothetical protein
MTIVLQFLLGLVCMHMKYLRMLDDNVRSPIFLALACKELANHIRNGLSFRNIISHTPIFLLVPWDLVLAKP